MDTLPCSLLSSTVGALVGSFVTLIGTHYLLYSANRPKFAERLIYVIKLNLAFLEPEKGTSVHGTHEDISFDEFHNFLSSLWPWQKYKLKKAWQFYQHPNSRNEKVNALKQLLKLVEKFSGKA